MKDEHERCVGRKENYKEEEEKKNRRGSDDKVREKYGVRGAEILWEVKEKKNWLTVNEYGGSSYTVDVRLHHQQK